MKNNKECPCYKTCCQPDCFMETPYVKACLTCKEDYFPHLVDYGICDECKYKESLDNVKMYMETQNTAQSWIKGGNMLTHFCRNPKHKGNFASAIESAVYNSIPDNKLLTQEDIVSLVMSSPECKQLRRPDNIKNILDSLVKGGFVKEAHGIALERFLGF